MQRTAVTVALALLVTSGQPGRYRLQLFTNITNLTNHQNLINYSGVATSRYFMKPTAATNLRKIDAGLTINF